MRKFSFSERHRKFAREVGSILLAAANPRGEAVDDPAQVYHNLLVALDVERGLNNGEPRLWARLFDRLEVRPGEHVIHVGMGLGYYTAILAELVGPGGRIVGIEVEPDLASGAQKNLSKWPQAEARAGNGIQLELGQVDVIAASAGVSHLPCCWIDALRDGGRLLVPLTTDGEWPVPGRGGETWTGGQGEMLLITRRGHDFAAEFVGPVGFYHGLGGRSSDADRRLRTAFAAGGSECVKSLRRPCETPDESCWLEGDGWWLSAKSPGRAD